MDATTVLPAVDQHGYLGGRRPLSIRAMSSRRTAVARACTAYCLQSAVELGDTEDPVESVVDQDAGLPDEFVEQHVHPTQTEILTRHRAALASRSRDHRSLSDLDDMLDRLDERVKELTRSISIAAATATDVS